MTEFEKWTTKRQLKSGRWVIKCKKGLWSVEAPTKNQATSEAARYFLQYFEDGEYQ